MMIQAEPYRIRGLTIEDTESILKLCESNPLYYEYCPPFVDRESIAEDLTVLPPGTKAEQKFFLGFFEEHQLIAVMDLIAGYPSAEIAFIGFFMTDAAVQKQGIGSRIIENIVTCLKEEGFQAVRLAWVKGNPQSEHFWKKNGFLPFRETSATTGECLIVAERLLI